MFHLKPDVMKKLQLKKEVIASLERSQMGALKGGILDPQTIGWDCKKTQEGPRELGCVDIRDIVSVERLCTVETLDCPTQGCPPSPTENCGESTVIVCGFTLTSNTALC